MSSVVIMDQKIAAVHMCMCLNVSYVCQTGCVSVPQ